jgi:hypothetical protein
MDLQRSKGFYLLLWLMQLRKYNVHFRTSNYVTMANKLALCLVIQVIRGILEFFVYSCHEENFRFAGSS